MKIAIQLSFLCCFASFVAQANPPNIRGVWQDEFGREIEIRIESTRVTVVLPGSLELPGSFENDATIVCETSYHAENLPSGFPRELIGNRVRFHGGLMDEGKLISASLNMAKEPLMINGERKQVDILYSHYSRKPAIANAIRFDARELLGETGESPLSSSADRLLPLDNPNKHILFVYGTNIVSRIRRDDKFEGSPFTYTILAQGLIGDERPEVSDVAKRFIRDQGFSGAWHRTPPGSRMMRLWQTAKNRAPASSFPPAPGYDLQVFILQASNANAVLPGLHPLSYRAVSKPWLLERGNVSIAARFLRQPDANADMDTIDIAYPNDSIRVELEASQATPLERVHVVLGKNGSILRDGSQETLAADRVNQTNVYRTKRIKIASEEGATTSLSGDDLTIAAKPEDSLQAIAIDDSSFSSRSAAQLQIAEAHRGLAPIWKTALKRAAELNRQERDWDNLSRREWTDISKLQLQLSAPVSGFTIGEHAAMLMLRTRFIEAMKVYGEAFPILATDNADYNQAVMGLARKLEPAMGGRSNPLGKVSVPYMPKDMSAGPLSYAELRFFYNRSFVLEHLNPQIYDRNNIRLEDPDTYHNIVVVQGLRQALPKYLEGINQAIQYAEGINDDDCLGLLRLTGNGFEAIAAVIRPQLVHTYEENGRRVVAPDTIARGHLGFIDNRFNSLSEDQKIRDDIIDSALLLATVATIPVGGSGGWLARLFVAGVGLLDAAHIAINRIPQWVRERQDLEFARNAEGVIGPNRLVAAQEQQTPWWAMSLEIAGLIGLPLDWIDAVGSIKLSVARNSALKNVNKIEELGLDGLKQLPRGEQVEFLVALMDARRTGALDPSALTNSQKRLLDSLNRFEREVVSEAMSNGRAVIDARMTAELPANLRSRVPVRRDPNIDADSVDVVYETTDGVITGVSIRAGRNASAELIQQHHDTATAMLGYSGLIGRARSLLKRAREWVSGRAITPPPGTRAFEAELELRKLSGIVENLARKIEGKRLTPAASRQALAQMEEYLSQMETYRRSLDEFDVSPGRGYVAASSRAESIRSISTSFSETELVRKARGRRGISPYGVASERRYREALARRMLAGEGGQIPRDLGQHGADLHLEMMQYRIDALYDQLKNGRISPDDFSRELRRQSQEVAGEVRGMIQRGENLRGSTEHYRSINRSADEARAAYDGASTYREIGSLLEGRSGTRTKTVGFRRMTDPAGHSDYQRQESRRLFSRVQEMVNEQNEKLQTLDRLRATASTATEAERLRRLSNIMTNDMRRIAEEIGFAGADDAVHRVLGRDAASVERIFPTRNVSDYPINQPGEGSRVFDTVYKVTGRDGKEWIYIVESKGSLTGDIRMVEDLDAMRNNLGYRGRRVQQTTPEYIEDVLRDMERAVERGSQRVPPEVVRLVREATSNNQIKSYLSATVNTSQPGEFVTSLFEVR